jgi:hypothetical protein
MFRSTFAKLRDFYNKSSHLYASFLVHNVSLILVVYSIFIISLSFGIFKIEFINQTQMEEYTIPRESESKQDIIKIKNTFYFNQTQNYFAHRLTDIGYFVEIIITPKSSNNTTNNDLIHQKYLNDYNYIYDKIINLEIHDVESNKTLKYSQDLCSKRLNKCAIEGSVMRLKTFQEQLLERKLFYAENDVNEVYVDTSAVDGTSFNFIFGVAKNRSESCEESEPVNKCFIRRVPVIRTRFDLLSMSENEKRHALDFMHVFVRFMQTIDSIDDPNYKHNLNISFFASQTTQEEITHYSTLEMNYIFVSIIAFWFCFSFVICFDVSSWFASIRNYIYAELKIVKITKSQTQSICIDGAGLLILLVVFQIIFNFVASIGLLSFLNVCQSQFISIVIFIAFFVGCNQSLLLHYNLKKYSSKYDADKSDRDDFIERGLTICIQQITIPSFMATMTSIVTYTFIFYTTKFDAIRNISLFTSNYLVFIQN